MSDRDKKIILVLMIIAVIALPYSFVIKDKRVETEAIKAETIELQNRLAELQEMDKQRDFYITETDRLNKERDKIIAMFPADIRPENYTMFLLNTEYSSAKVDENGEMVWEYPIRFDTVSYSDNIETPISNEDADTGYIALTNTSGLTYFCYYDGFKYLLDYLMEYEDPMIYSTITAKFDSETGIVSGEIGLTQYAVSGGDRTLAPVVIKPNLDTEELRGNEEVGIFGPVTKVAEEEEETTAETNNDTQEETGVVVDLAQ